MIENKRVKNRRDIAANWTANNPVLLATYCYSSMFYGCKSLTTAPVLPATTLANSCYEQMFRSCTSLTTAPALPATTLVNSCYYGMFNNCTSLTAYQNSPDFADVASKIQAMP